MKTTTFAFLVATLTLAICFTSTAQAANVTFDWATVGNPNNAPDTTTYGAVANTYRISKTEVTNAQYTEFLNAVDPAGGNSLSLYNSSMSSNARGGINFNGGGASGSKYEIKTGRDNNPIVFVSFFDAMRFTNWLENDQGSGSTESGVYTIGTGLDEVRNPNATYFIPSEDQWYKAAYYDPRTEAQGGPAGDGNYWLHATQVDTDAELYSDNPSSLNTPDDSSTANFRNDGSTANGYNDGYAVTGSTSFDNSQNYLTDVGAYTTSLSQYGTYDQGGNVFEWNEAVISSSFRGIRGGGWTVISSDLAASFRQSGNPAIETHDVGFRVASIPEPSTLLLGVMASVGVLMRRRRLG